MTFSTLLDEQQNKIWLNEKEQIQRLLDILASFETEPSDLEHLRQALEQLNELFLLVVVGEFNSGKTALNPWSVKILFSIIVLGVYVNGLTPS